MGGADGCVRPAANSEGHAWWSCDDGGRKSLCHTGATVRWSTPLASSPMACKNCAAPRPSQMVWQNVSPITNPSHANWVTCQITPKLISFFFFFPSKGSWTWIILYTRQVHPPLKIAWNQIPKFPTSWAGKVGGLSTDPPSLSNSLMDYSFLIGLALIIAGFFFFVDVVMGMCASKIQFFNSLRERKNQPSFKEEQQ